MSGAVGSIPSLTRSLRPCDSASQSFAESPPDGRQSTAFRASRAASWAVDSGTASLAFGIGANARLSPFRGPREVHRRALRGLRARCIARLAGLSARAGGHDADAPLAALVREDDRNARQP